ncbi:hypothetical protein J6590_001307 [Homalodisca vitripennis]|nr:hypothetical protein J6590_001307 [Homalodisca vitripennis]
MVSPGLKIGDRVFPKLKGYPYWPGIVKSIFENDNLSKTPRYQVRFYGCHDYAIIKQTNICPYEQYGLPKVDNFRNKKFNIALQEAKMYKALIQNQELQSTAPIKEIGVKIDSCGEVDDHDLETSLTLAASPLPKSKDTVEDIPNKILSINEVDDLETSLTLAAEAVNALLAENRKLKQDEYALTLKHSQLVQHITCEKHCSDLKIAEEKIEILESENEILLNRNATLVEMLTEMEHQLVKEKELWTNLMQMFEEQDREREKAIYISETKIKQLIQK